MKISKEQMAHVLGSLEAESAGQRMARFRKACPESAQLYDDAERDTRLIIMTLQRAFLAPNGEQAHHLAEIVAKDVTNVAIKWAVARDAYVRFCEKDPGPWSL